MLITLWDPNMASTYFSASFLYLLNVRLNIMKNDRVVMSGTRSSRYTCGSNECQHFLQELL